MGLQGAFAIISNVNEPNETITKGIDADFYHIVVESKDILVEYVDKDLLKDDLIFCDWNNQIIHPSKALESLNRFSEFFKSVNYIKVFNKTDQQYIIDNGKKYLYNGKHVQIPTGHYKSVANLDLWLLKSESPIRDLQEATFQQYSFIGNQIEIEADIQVEFHHENYYERHKANFDELMLLCQEAQRLRLYIYLCLW
ncbi:hypothetical protein GCM10028807_62960 [Spirosoma daeguense]